MTKPVDMCQQIDGKNQAGFTARFCNQSAGMVCQQTLSTDPELNAMNLLVEI